MRIEKLVLQNYRQFRHAELDFSRTAGNDLHIIRGMNGTGKTNILNAFNWCLYGDEPHLAKDSQQLPRLNLGCIRDSDGSQNEEVRAELWLKTRDGNYLVFERRESYRVQGHDEHPLVQERSFEARVTDAKGNIKILRDEEAAYCAERFVPRLMREFFLFDGERLDRYFKEATAQNIRHAVFELSQIHLLENLEQKLDATLKDVRREAGKASPAIEQSRERLDTLENRLGDLDTQRQACIDQVNLSKDKIAEYLEMLRGVPDVATLEAERQGLGERRKQKEQLRADKAAQKREALFQSGMSIGVWPAMDQILQIIDQKREDNEIPPTVDKGLLDSILRDHLCRICGRALDEESTRHVKQLAEEVRLSSAVLRELVNMENALRLRADTLSHFDAQLREMTSEIREYETELDAIERRKNEIDRELEGYNIHRITEWHKERQNFENARDTNQRKLGMLDAQRDGLLVQIRALKASLDKELKKETKLAQLRKEIGFCASALEVVRQTKHSIMTQTRREIESETKALFMDFAWKKETFRDVHIDDDYGIHLMHSMGYDCLGAASAAERELLALSFTLALHKVSGFDSPIVIDTPVARVSDEHRVNFGRVLLEVSADKQTVLLFTPAEYSQDLAGVIDRHSSNRLELKLSSDENEARVEVL